MATGRPSGKSGAVVVAGGPDLMKARAEADGRRFVDARQVPFMNCACGQALDFTPTDTGETVM